MSVLDDARRLVTAGEPSYCAEPDGSLRCTYCGGAENPQMDEPNELDVVHAADCPWLSMPKIIVALEAAEAVLNAADDAAYPNWNASIPRPVVRALYDLEIALGDAAP